VSGQNDFQKSNFFTVIGLAQGLLETHPSKNGNAACN
jgi:hypothetical protein